MSRTSRADRVVELAIEWWAGRRPLDYSRADHLLNPTINTGGAFEGALAAAVAALLAERDKHQALEKPVRVQPRTVKR